MSDIAIKVENVSKIFKIFDKPGDRLKEAFSYSRRKYHTAFSALKNISFEIKKGEFMGIVGKNGAGKSTLLKILSGELIPTSGKVTINGKVALLQLGVGFDPELTGIENARFASKLLGYDDYEVEGMLEDIIAFADIGEFIHHPVKTYSSGMHSRLSFAVGVNINPDILIADEVLSVGDMRFAQKCLRKMREFKENGKTIVLVTHSIETVHVFCDTAIWVKDGEIFEMGDAKSIATDFTNFMLYNKLPDQYAKVIAPQKFGEQPISCKELIPDMDNEGTDYNNAEWEILSKYHAIGDGRAELKRMAFLLEETKERVTCVQGNETVILLLDIIINETIERPHVGFVLYNRQGLAALHSNNQICGKPLEVVLKGQRFMAQFKFDLPGLANGNYIFAVGLQSGEDIPHRIHDVCEFRVSRDDIKGAQCGYVIIENESFELRQFH